MWLTSQWLNGQKQTLTPRVQVCRRGDQSTQPLGCQNGWSSFPSPLNATAHPVRSKTETASGSYREAESPDAPERGGPPRIVTDNAREPTLSGITAQHFLQCEFFGHTEVTWADAFARYQRWCGEQSPSITPLGPAAFGRELKALCKYAGIRTRARGEDVLCLNVKLGCVINPAMHIEIIETYNFAGGRKWLGQVNFEVRVIGSDARVLQRFAYHTIASARTAAAAWRVAYDDCPVEDTTKGPDEGDK